MRKLRWVLGALSVSASLGLAACGSSTGGTGGTPTSGSTATTTTHPSSSSTSVAIPSSGSAAVNVPITDEVRAQLVAAGAAVNGIPVGEYSGLAPGLTYLALDQATGTYWAGARLVPAPTSDPSAPSRAQVASQDDGSYYVFSQPRGGIWTAHATGASGPDTPCSITVPSTVLAIWGWPAGGCRPSGA